MAKPAKDASVFAHIEALVAEEHRLFEHGELSDEQKTRLGEVQIELDRYWDLLRQRRALREYGRDPSEAHERDPDTVKKYIGKRASVNAPPSPTLEARRAQMFPALAADEIARLHRFGKPRRFADGAQVLETGRVSPGIYVVLKGAIRVTGRDGHGHELPVTEHGPGNFSGELSQLSRGPSFVDGIALGETDTLVGSSPIARSTSPSGRNVARIPSRSAKRRRAEQKSVGRPCVCTESAVVADVPLATPNLTLVSVLLSDSEISSDGDSSR